MNPISQRTSYAYFLCTDVALAWSCRVLDDQLTVCILPAADVIANKLPGVYCLLFCEPNEYEGQVWCMIISSIHT